jgi:hypothetical protein
MSMLSLPLVEVLARVDGLVFAHPEEGIESTGQQRAQEWSDPVDPVIPGEASVDHVWAE